MRPGVIPDEHSHPEDQTVNTRRYRSHCKRLRLVPTYYRNWKYSESYNAVYLRYWTHRRRCGLPTKQLPRTISAIQSRIQRNGWLSLKKRQQLDTLVRTIYKDTALMKQALLTAAHSQLIDPAFMKKLAAVKDSLEAEAVKIKTYNENNKEHGTMELKERVMYELVDARKQFAYLSKILDLERAEL